MEGEANKFGDSRKEDIFGLSEEILCGADGGGSIIEIFIWLLIVDGDAIFCCCCCCCGCCS